MKIYRSKVRPYRISKQKYANGKEVYFFESRRKPLLIEIIVFTIFFPMWIFVLLNKDWRWSPCSEEYENLNTATYELNNRIDDENKEYDKKFEDKLSKKIIGKEYL